MLIDPNYNNQNIFNYDDNISLEEAIDIINMNENERLIKVRNNRLSSEDCYCGNYYKDKEGFQNYLKLLGREDDISKIKPCCPIRKVSKLYAEENFIKIEDIPKGLFYKSPIDEYLFNDKADKFIDKLGHRLDIIDNANNLNEAFQKYYKEPIKKKESIQRYRANQLRNELIIKRKIEANKFKPNTAHEFKLNERGHIRYIKAPSTIDQIVQRSANDNLLIPNIIPKLIYDNGASLKNKGVSFSRNRFKHHLRSAYKEFGKDAYIIQIDFSKYFDNIFHDKLKEKLSSIFDEKELEFISIFIDEFNIDVSYMTDYEYELLNTIPFNSLEYNKYINSDSNVKSLLNRTKVLERSMGIGNHIAQISGVLYPTNMDNYITKVKGYKYYGRYMDDIYIIVKNKKDSKQLLKEIYNYTKNEGLFINKKKTRIISINSWITFLKIKYFITDSYKIIEKPISKTFKREYKRITKLHKLVMQNKLSKKNAIICYKSWRGSYKKFDCGYNIKNLDDYVINLFELEKDHKFKNKNNIL